MHVNEIWEAHRSTDWPTDLGSQEGELMMIDTVMSGCATYYLEAEDGLDPQRREMLKSCVEDLENLLPDLDPSAEPYFQRLHQLGSLMLGTGL
ncbi:MAG: hypothetical protein O7F12_07855 [Nitrospirae bacterium]|nr:hypothetical protein [Nitrospirota bacterium]